MKVRNKKRDAREPHQKKQTPHSNPHRGRVFARLKVQHAQPRHQLAGQVDSRRVGRERERRVARGGGVAVTKERRLV